MLTNPETITRIATSEEELRQIFAQSALAPIEPFLRFDLYFPRSAERVTMQERRSFVGQLICSCLLGVMLAGAAVSLWRLSPRPFVYVVVAALPLLVLGRRLMTSVFAATSEAQKFVELMCFDRRAPVVYLRRFQGEDPVLQALTSRNSVVGRATNPAGTDRLENVAQLLDTVGPVLGIGRPADRGIEHRIRRLYTPDEHWHEVVRFFLREARAVLMSYEPSPLLDWELAQALQSRHAVLFLLLRGLPEAVVRDAGAAMGALPVAVRALECTKTHMDKVSEKYLADEYGRPVARAPEAVRVHGVKVHFQQLWDVLFEEIVHTLKFPETRAPAPMPPAYRGLVRAVEGPAAWWSVLAFATSAALAGGTWWAM